MNTLDWNHLANRLAFWTLVFAIIAFTMSPFVYALSISFRTNPQVLTEARYLPEASNFDRQFNLNRLQIVDVVDEGELEEHIILQNVGERTLNLDGWRILSDQSYELLTITNVYDPSEPDANFLPSYQGYADQDLSLRGTRAINDIGTVFTASQRNFPPENVATPQQVPAHEVVLPRQYNLASWNEINNVSYEFDIVVDFFTRYEFEDVRLDPGETISVFTGEGIDTENELYMGIQFDTGGRGVFSGRLWGDADTVITINNARSLPEATYTVGIGRVEWVQIVNQHDLGRVPYPTFEAFLIDEMLTGERLLVFLAAFGGTTAGDEIFTNLSDDDSIQAAITAYGEQDSDFNVVGALDFIDVLSDAVAVEEFVALLESRGFEPEYIDSLAEEATQIQGERIEVQHFGETPVNLEGWRLTNTQDQRSQFDLPAFTLQPDTVVSIVTGYGVNSDEAIFLRNEDAVWEDEQVANLTDTNGLRRSRYIIGGEVYALRNYTNLIEDDTFLRNLWNSAVVATVSVTLSLIVGSFAAYALGRVRFRGQYIILYLVLAMTMFPQISILSGMFEIVDDLDIYNSNLAMIFSYPLFTLPFTVWVLTSFFQGLPAEIEQAALVDGASAFQTFWRILVPLTAPALVTTGLLAFIAAWNEYLFALTFTLGEEQRTVPVAIAQFAGFDREEATADKIAAAVVVTIPLLVLVLVFQRRIVEGLTAGAVKG